MNKIICAAIRLKDGRVFNGLRHNLCLLNAKEAGVALPVACEEGFLTWDYAFVDRVEAAKIAHAAGQVSRDVLVLYSEHLY